MIRATSLTQRGTRLDRAKASDRFKISASILLIGTLLLLITQMSPVHASPINDALSQMSLAEKVGQLVMIRVHDRTLSSAEYALIVKSHIGGVILFGDNYSSRTQLRAFTARVQKAGRAGNGFGIGTLISADQEGGAVKRFPDLPPTLSAPQIGQIGSSSVAYDQGSRTGAALHSVGVNMDLAPVVDLNEAPNYIMSKRSFGSSPSRVARLSSQFVKGLQHYRVAATLKHFPGLGAAKINSDSGVAWVYRYRNTMEAYDLVPFESGIDAGAKAVMVSHGIYVNAWGRVPASVNPSIAHSLLRSRKGFKGVSISDSLNAIAWRYGGTTSRACVETIKAGVDIALVTGGSSTSRGCASAIYDAASRGYIPMSRINEAVARILSLKIWLRVWLPTTSPSPTDTQTPSPSPSPTETSTIEPSPNPTG